MCLSNELEDEVSVDKQAFGVSVAGKETRVEVLATAVSVEDKELATEVLITGRMSEALLSLIGNEIGIRALVVDEELATRDDGIIVEEEVKVEVSVAEEEVNVEELDTGAVVLGDELSSGVLVADGITLTLVASDTMSDDELETSSGILFDELGPSGIRVEETSLVFGDKLDTETFGIDEEILVDVSVYGGKLRVEVIAFVDKQGTKILGSNEETGVCCFIGESDIFR